MVQKSSQISEWHCTSYPFSFSHGVLYPLKELSAIFIKFKIVICNLSEFGRVQNLSFGIGLKDPERLAQPLLKNNAVIGLYELTSDNTTVVNYHWKFRHAESKTIIQKNIKKGIGMDFMTKIN